MQSRSKRHGGGREGGAGAEVGMAAGNGTIMEKAQLSPKVTILHLEDGDALSPWAYSIVPIPPDPSNVLDKGFGVSKAPSTTLS